MGVFLLSIVILFYIKLFLMPSGGKSKSRRHAGYRIAL